ncbi:MAG: exopolysaccharide biosynthesis polyprenyl glycosylphosphotransferase, partial [Bacteroidales bacterium]
MARQTKINNYILCDLLVAILSWILFFGFRKLEEGFSFSNILASMYSDSNFWKGLLLYPGFWFCLHYISGYYRQIYRKSRTEDIQKSFYISVLGCLILFFSIILDDVIGKYTLYYTYLFTLFFSYFPLLLFFRLLLSSRTHQLIQEKKIGFNTLLIGNGNKANSIYHDLENEKPTAGNRFIGYVKTNSNRSLHPISLGCLGNISQIREIIYDAKIEEVIIALEDDEKELLTQILGELYADSLIIKVSPNFESYLLGAVKTNSIFSTPLIVLSFDAMPLWQKALKRMLDCLFCALGLLLLSPLLLYTAYRVKKSSPGPIFYTQERLGLHGVKFQIIKFRSMYLEAEDNIPLLTNDEDPRVTAWGKIMRKYRLDELPQFYNVLKGDMALVGPRPEREYFVNLICQTAPHYRLLLNAKPGITSWGEIKYGYAENIQEMILRMQYDLLY